MGVLEWGPNVQGVIRIVIDIDHVFMGLVW